MKVRYLFELGAGNRLIAVFGKLAISERQAGHDLEVVLPLNRIESAPRVMLAVASRWVGCSV